LAGITTSTGGNVFVLEDEPLILLELGEMLGELNWRVSHAASDVDTAVQVAKSARFDLAIIDVNVKGRPSLSVAEILRRRGVPVIVATGYSTDSIRGYYPDVTYLQKPYLVTDLAAAVEHAIARQHKPLRQTA